MEYIMATSVRTDEEQSTQKRASILGLDYVDTSAISNKQLFKNILPAQELSNLRVVPITADRFNIQFGITNTTSQHSIEQLRQQFLDQRLSFALISDSGFKEYMLLYNPPKPIVYQNIELTSAGTEELVKNVSVTLEQVRADDMLAYLVSQAHKLKASDIHIENQRDSVRIRLRIDGVLHPIARLTHEKNHILLSAIASAGNVSTNEEDAQQGHISERVTMADGSKVDVNLRLETVPTISGMDVVMRLFNMEENMYTLDKLGLSDIERKIVDDIIAKPSGLVMAVGPTGSGKTTTLYSILNTLNNEDRKIITIEDPVEFQFAGITQIPVRTRTAKESMFADKLRAVLRLDPDVVMVGEIRDLDTAKTALQASLTGHLVLTTFHAGSSAAALTRLLDIIEENPLLATAIRLVMAQRLVRKLDDTCKVAYVPSEAELKQLKAVVETLPPNYKKPDLTNLQLYKPGKTAENPYGYKGQLPLREQFVMSDSIISLLQKGTKGASTQDIEKAAIASGMITMRQDGILKVIEGKTTLKEVTRVIG
jgi:type II secretory ATPase GspE/PulE/Tfp pilus assembly ATPase PilB-like protein